MKKTVLFILLMLFPLSAFSFDHNHTIFDNLLKEHVKLYSNGTQTKVDYNGFIKDSKKFEKYLKQLSSVKKSRFDKWSKDNRLAFLINAYNAFTIKLIMKHYPIKSIKKVTSFYKSPWKINFVRLFGEKVSLDDIEHGMIRKKDVYDEPRIHFAVVCASIGCPALQNSAFTGAKLEKMLEDGLIKFLSDHTRNRFDSKKNRFEVSKIFKWYGDDFKKRYGSVVNLLNFYGKYLKDKPKNIIIDIDYLDYDWNLNGVNQE